MSVKECGFSAQTAGTLVSADTETPRDMPELTAMVRKMNAVLDAKGGDREVSGYDRWLKGLRQLRQQTEE